MSSLSKETVRASYTIPSLIEVEVEIREGVDGKLKYFVHEPVLSESGRALLRSFIDRVYRDASLMKTLSTYDFSDRSYSEVSKLVKDHRKRVSSTLFKSFGKSHVHQPVDESEVATVAYYVMRDLIGYGPIDPLIRDREIEDVTCNGVGMPVYVFHREFEWLETNVVFSDAEGLEKVLRVLAIKSGQEPSIANPIVEGVLKPEGFRIHMVLDTVSRRGHSFSIRRFREAPFTVVELLGRGTLDAGLAALFWIAVENKQGLVIYGPTGSGKTTLLNALAMLLPSEMKIVSAEDTPEIHIPFHENWVSMVTRLSTDPRILNVTLQAQMESAMRQRPDVLILGEIRSREAYAFFQGVSTGHGGLTTVHAESLEALMRRLTSPPMNVPKSNLAATKLYVNVLRISLPSGVVRKVVYVYEVADYDPLRDLIELKLISKWDSESDSWVLDLRESSVLKAAAQLSLSNYEDVLADLIRRATILHYAATRRVDIFEFHSLIRRYKREPDRTYEELRALLGDPYRLMLHELGERKSL